MSIKELFREVEELLEQAGLSDPRRTGVWIFCDVLQCKPAHLISHEDDRLKRNDVAEISAMAARCAAHEPVQYVTGYTEFRGLHLQVSSQVLIPRPETEQLVEVALEAVGRELPFRILDIGTGSGCIALAMKQAIPDASVAACDISRSALHIARANATQNGLEIQCTAADLLAADFVRSVGSGYDLVIANPPYIPDHERSGLPRMVRDYEPEAALFCGEDPLKFYRAISRHIADGLLGRGGILALETHADYAESIGTLLEQHRGLRVQVKQDFAGLPRFVLAKFPRKLSSSQE
ncbi:MAG: peptide chain release factor N(5)-glutamine methyltransferase [Bacteroidota bacterium]|nr:peptide chain release factor N(5)-glutamine methyltransferase [Bacteroidota bacterium]MDE2645354.1 peptide chain release factor N(5)-glutamine methyltransferase [Bacteroidota bacterium]